MSEISQQFQNLQYPPWSFILGWYCLVVVVLLRKAEPTRIQIKRSVLRKQVYGIMHRKVFPFSPGTLLSKTFHLNHVVPLKV